MHVSREQELLTNPLPVAKLFNVNLLLEGPVHDVIRFQVHGLLVTMLRYVYVYICIYRGVSTYLRRIAFRVSPESADCRMEAQRSR